MIDSNNIKNWMEAIVIVASHYGISFSEEKLKVAMEWEHKSQDHKILESMAKQAGMSLKISKFSADMLNPWRLPLVARMEDGNICVIQTNNGKGQLGVIFAGDERLETAIPTNDALKQIVQVLILKPQIHIPDVRVDNYIAPYKKDWFWRIALQDWKRYTDIIIASIVANVLALSTITFSMQVYDRVVPSKSIPTLYVLFGGVCIAIIFEFTMRLSRAHISDVIGKRADLKISDIVFGHSLRVKNSERPKSTGTFISQLREMDQVRELFTSTTIGAMADLPFFFLFLIVLWSISGPLVIVLLFVIPLILIPGICIQKPLARFSKEGMRESALRNAMLVETVQNNEDIKLMRSEARFQNHWNFVNDVAASISMKQRLYTNTLMTWTQELQSIIFAVVLFIGSQRVMNGDMTTGSLVATTMLSSRMIAPLAQISGICARWQQAKVAREGLHELMKKNVDYPDGSRLVHRNVLHGNFSFSNVVFRYGEKDPKPALVIPNLQIKSGEKIAILGRIGAGKSTLLQLISGMQSPKEGRIAFDDIELHLLDPSDVRRDISYLTQTARLFFGTIRENLTMGAPLADDELVMKAAADAGALSLIQNLPQGLDTIILEGGSGLSGGQRQALLLARVLIRNSNVLLLDEPTANFDDNTEKHALDSIERCTKNCTLIISTHRLAPLRLVDRIIVVDKGQIVMDGPKDKVIGELSK